MGVRTSRAIISTAIAVAIAACDRVSTAPSAVSSHTHSLRNTTAEHSFFTAWSWPDTARNTVILTDPYAVSISQWSPDLYRQIWIPVTMSWGMADTISHWAAQNPGKRYILGDEVDQNAYANDPTRLARDYCWFIRHAVPRDSDATATFGPGGWHDYVTESYLNAFIDAYENGGTYANGGCSDVPISEWSFNILTTPWSGGLTAFQNLVNTRMAWAVGNGRYNGKYNAPMTIGAWTLDGDAAVADQSAEYVARLQQAKAWLFSQPNILAARYLLFEPWGPDHHPLSDGYGNLTAEGLVICGCVRPPRY